jgi:transglutaminase-like putative cysteine protease
MAFAPRFFMYLVLLGAGLAHGEDSVRFRNWIGGQEVGGSVRRHSRDAAGERFEDLEWTRLERLGTVIEQRLQETAVKGPDGVISFTWTLSISQEPMTGRASWSPAEPGRLKLWPKGGRAQTIDLPAGAVLWPKTEEDRLKQAARKRVPVRMSGFSMATQTATGLDLEPLAADPLPGFPDAVRFQGRASEGKLDMDIQVWISPTQGELRNQRNLGGITMLEQRAELPPPEAVAGAGAGAFFDRVMKVLPANPFLLWLPEVKVRWSGRETPRLPEDAQQKASGGNRFTLTRAQPPAAAAARELPVRGRPEPELAPYLAASPLVQFKDPVFTGLLARLKPQPGASRWDLAKQVNTFVFDWIRDKNYTVGFASAQEVARNERGDCTEHGVLAVALLRRLGVPARGVTGWVALDQTLGLHFWVEVQIGGRWIPIDPTFDQAPASAYRLKLGTSDLSNLGSTEWENAATTFLEGSWEPDGDAAQAIRIQGDHAWVAGLVQFSLPGAAWQQEAGALTLLWEGRHSLAAVTRPSEAQLAGAELLQGAGSGRRGWWSPARQELQIDLGEGRWLRISAVGPGQAARLLAELQVQARP